MSKNPDEKHVHTFERMKSRSGRKDIYRCIHPKCTFYAPASMIMGKEAKCKLCFSSFILTPDTLRLKVPHCGCRSLTPEQRERLSQLGKTEEDQAAMSMKILEGILRKGM